MGRRYHLRVLRKRFERSFHGFYPQTWTLEPHYMSPKQPTVELLSFFLVRQLYINSYQTKRDTSGENRAVVPKRGKVTQYRANTEAWSPDDDCFRTCVNFRAHRKPNKRIRWKTVLKCPFFPSLPLFAFFVSGFASYGFFAFLHVAGDRISVSSTASSSSFPEVQSPKILPEGKHSNNIIIIIADSSNATKHITTTTMTTTTTTTTTTPTTTTPLI